MLTVEKNVSLPDLNFPTVWQAVIFRNYATVPPSHIAEALGCDAETVVKEAQRLGLDNVEYDPQWLNKGYITVIRNNWYLLPYAQLLTLLDIDSHRLEFILKEEDFLDVKLGLIKPVCPEVRYAPLTEDEIKETERIRERVRSLHVNGEEKYRAFDLVSRYSDVGASDEMQRSSCDNFIHGYLTPCADAFSVCSESYLPDGLLEAYKAQGVKGIWIHGVLSALSPYPFDPSLSFGYREKRRRLSELIDRAKKYGLKIYLYLNEPRYLPTDKTKGFDDLLGHTTSRGRSLCFSDIRVRNYLREAVRDLLTECPVGGIITITMSENQTHCKYSGGATNCKRCKSIPPWELVSSVNNTVLEGVRAAGTNTEVIANLWGWTEAMGFTEDGALKAISALDREISVLAVSEFNLAIEKGGIKGEVIDYSISNPGPSAVTVKNLGYARANGRKVYAKIQVNNSWECSAVPYLPVYDLVKEHLDNLSDVGIENYMLSWTHGGAPSPTLDLISTYKPHTSLDGWYKRTYGKDAVKVREAVGLICRGFKEYPFSCSHMYFSPQTLGPANMWSLRPLDSPTSMVGYAFDNLEKWTERYPVDVFLSQTEKMLGMWKEGIGILGSIEDPEPTTSEALLFAKVAYIHLECDLLHTEYALLKRNVNANKSRLLELVSMARLSTVRLLRLMNTDSRIGFEASNHYYYTRELLKEKVLNLDKLERELNSL